MPLLTWALGALLFYAVFAAGAVDVTTWTWCVLGLGILGTLALARRPTPAFRPLDRLSASLLAIVFALAVLQVVPVPMAWIQRLSPLRHTDLNALATLGLDIPRRAALSFVPDATRTYLLTLGAGIVSFLAVRSLASDRSPIWRLTWPLFVITAFQAALGIFQAYTEGTDGIATGTYANRDHYAFLLEMVLPFALLYPPVILAQDRRRFESPALPALQACVPLGVAVLLLVAIIHTLSRMGFLAALAALFVCGSMAFTLREWRVDYEVSQMPLWRQAMPAFTVALIVFAGFIFLPTDPLIARFSDLARTEDISADTRAQIWRDTMGLVKASPWVGCGWGGYESAFLRFKRVAPMSTVDYAHNDYLQVLVEAGIPAFAAGLLLILRLVWRTLRSAVYATNPEQRYLAIACSGSFTAVLLHSFVDFNLYVPANFVAFCWIAGMAGVWLRQPRAVTEGVQR
ncbi:MAG: O-antigen ligase family protein [Bryobacterales bacterium]|nr:O-antigen ligase family protein [Bryobacterales bacterium]